MQTLVPTAVVLGNLSGSAADLDDSPDTPDANWCVRVGSTSWTVTPSIGAFRYVGQTPTVVVQGLPAWIEALDVGEWVEVPTSNSIGDVTYGTSPGGTVENVVNAWCGIAASSSGDVYMFGGGHADYAGNEIYKLALGQASPVYSRLNDPTATVRTDQDYYADGNPTARHTYQSLCVRGDELVCVGGAALWGTGNAHPQYTDIFDLTNLSWTTQVAAGGTWAACIDRETGVIYAQSPDTWEHKFRALSTGNSWTVLGSAAVQPHSTFASSCFDSARDRIWVIGNYDTLEAHYWEVGTGATDPTLSGANAAIFDDAGSYMGVDYDDVNDCILLKAATGATVYKLDCDTLECTTYSTSGATPGNATNAVNGRFKYVPDLKGFIYVPSWGNAYFLRTVA